jgi:hypothetical protein
MRLLALIGLLPLAHAAFPMAAWPECGTPDRPDLCPPDLGEDWALLSYVPAAWQGSLRPDEVAMGSGIGADLAWRGEKQDVGRDAMLAQRTQLTASLRKAGFAESEIIFEATTVRRLEPAVYIEPPLGAGEKQPVRGRQLIDFDTHARGQVPEYVFAQHLTLQSADVARIEAFSRQEFFPSGGVSIVRSTPIFRLLNLADVKKDLLESAAKDAQRRALTMVNGSGSHLGSLLEAAQGVIQISAKDRIDESDSGSVDISSIDKTIRVVVTMRFELVKE